MIYFHGDQASLSTWSGLLRRCPPPHPPPPLPPLSAFSRLSLLLLLIPVPPFLTPTLALLLLLAFLHIHFLLFSTPHPSQFLFLHSFFSSSYPNVSFHCILLSCFFSSSHSLSLPLIPLLLSLPDPSNFLLVIYSSASSFSSSSLYL